MHPNLILRFAVVFMVYFWICISALQTQTMPWQKIQSTTATNIVFIKPTSVGLFMVELSFATTSLSTDNGNTWKILPYTRVARDFAETSNSIFFLDGQLFKSVNKDSLFLSPPQSIPIQDQSQPNLLYNYDGYALAAKDSMVFFGITLRFFRSFNEGKTLNQITLNPYSYYIHEVIVDNNQTWASSEQGLFRSLDNGETWTHKAFEKINVNIYAASKNRLFIVSSPRDRNGSALPSSYYRSLDTGNTWQAFLLPDSSKYLYRFVLYEQNIIIGTDKGLYRSKDNGTTWQNISYNLPEGGISALAVDTKTKTLFAAVYQHGLYRTDLTTVSTREEPQNTLFISSPVPNPSSDYTELTFTLPRAAKAGVTLYSTLGTEVWRSESVHLSAGEQHICIYTRHLPSGVYAYRLMVDGVSSVGRIVVVR